LAVLDLGADAEQSFNYLIVQNHQAVQSVGKLMDSISERNMIDCLFFRDTLRGRRRKHTPFAQAGAETPDTSAEAVKSDPGSCWEGHSVETGTSVWN